MENNLEHVILLQDENEEASAAFTAQDIDQILEQRTQQRQIGG